MKNGKAILQINEIIKLYYEVNEIIKKISVIRFDLLRNDLHINTDEFPALSQHTLIIKYFELSKNDIDLLVNLLEQESDKT